MHIQANYSLLKHNSFHIQSKTQYYAEVSRQSDILTLRSDLKLASLPWRIMGGGSNLLFTENFNGVTVCCTFNKIKIMQEDEDNVWLSVGAGVPWIDLVRHTVSQGWWGLENLALIPGTVGAAPVQNIGAYGSEARDCITRVQTLDLFDGQRREFRNSECNFDYRTSIFKEEFNNRLLVHRVTFRLKKLKAGHANLYYEPLKEALANYEKDELTPQIVCDTVERIRRNRLPDPKKMGNAGSFFKNPVVDQEYFEKLSQDFPEMPHHRMVSGCYKIPAAWLIEQVGWKGKSIGQAGVCDLHALVLVNLGGATGCDIKNLSQTIQEEVNHKFGIHLEPEVLIW